MRCERCLTSATEDSPVPATTGASLFPIPPTSTLASLTSLRLLSNIHIYSLPSPLPEATTKLGASGAARVFPTQTLSAHTSFVYDLARTPSGEVLSAGEDRSVRVWRGECSLSLCPLALSPRIEVRAID